MSRSERKNDYLATRQASTADSSPLALAIADRRLQKHGASRSGCSWTRISRCVLLEERQGTRPGRGRLRPDIESQSRLCERTQASVRKAHRFRAGLCLA